MTDGAAKTFESLNLEAGKNQEIKEAYEKLTSREPSKFWTSGSFEVFFCLFSYSELLLFFQVSG